MANESEPAVKVLRRYFRPNFADLAVNLPPSCTFWTALEDEIDLKACSKDDLRVTDIPAFLGFLSFFFSDVVLQDVAEKLTILSNSSLGLAYTFRKGKAEVAKAVLADIHEHPALENFFGWVSLDSQAVFSGEGGEGEPAELSATHADHGEEPDAKGGRVLDDDASTSDAALSGLQPAIVSAARSGEGGATRVPKGDAEGNEDPQAGGGEGMGGIGGGGASSGRGRVVDDGASGGGDGGDGSRENFPGLYENVVIIDLPAFHTPPKNAFNRSQTLKARSKLFSTHPNIQGGLTHMYDPFYSRRRVLLYHGTRSSSLGSFKSKGIFPKLRPNEFSVTHAFYTSNSLRQAFEHPMHKHVAGNIVDPVSVLVFEVDVAVLHGEKLPIGGSSEFKCRWFPGDTPARLKAWSDFCAANLSTEVLPHTYDVVIGPICYWLDDGGYAKLCGEMPNSIPLTQVAFCTPAARAWLQKCFTRVYMERRST